MDITCPRCANPVAVEFYAPCAKCCDELRFTMGADGSAVAPVAEYEPKMNVTPNAVALKDD